MKTIKTIPALVLTALMVAGPVSAASISDLDTVAVSTGSAILTVDGDVATLMGNVDGSYEKAVLERAALELEGVEEVRNLLSF